MPILIGLHMRRALEFVYGDPHSIYVVPGEKVVLDTDNGLEWATVIDKEKMINKPDAPVYRIVRKFNTDDSKKLEDIKHKECQALRVCQDKIEQHKLDMKLTCVEYIFERSKLFVYYTAEGRIDFRELIKDLGHTLKTKIQMVQIGVRDEAKMLGGYGACGRELCCAKFLKDFKPVVIDMAKEQGISLNPSKISGCCGRLMCCLSYENAFYKQMIKKMPKPGTKINTKDGTGIVKSVNIFKEEIEVIFDDGSVKIYKIDELKDKKK
ncbi:MAG: regulatory iron-sulfur-containing complex subunit RicT [Elusimicrobiota bacterium]